MIFLSVFFNATNNNLFLQLSGCQVFETLLWRQPFLVPQLFHPPCVALYSCIHLLHSGICETPKPLELLVFGAHITTQPISVPHCSKYLFRLSAVVSKFKPLMKSFCSSSGLLEGSDLDVKVMGGETFMMFTQWCPWTEKQGFVN